MDKELVEEKTWLTNHKEELMKCREVTVAMKCDRQAHTQQLQKQFEQLTCNSESQLQSLLNDIKNLTVSIEEVLTSHKLQKFKLYELQPIVP